jgi:hypothetical protein
MPLVEEVPDHRSHCEHDGDDHPVESRGVEQRVVIADHQHDHRQREIVVVDRALLAGLAELRIGRLARDQGCDDLLLVRDDHGEDIGDYDGADDRAGLVEGAASAQHTRP